MKKFKRLFEPGKIGKLELINRIVMPPMALRHAADNGSVSDRQIDYYAERARGGVGLIVVEATYPRISGYPARICIAGDEYIPSLRKLSDAIHQGGAKAIVQINPNRGRADEIDPASASDIPHPITGIRPRVLSTDDIARIRDEFGEATRRAKQAGFDGIMIHGGHGYLVQEFISPMTNLRTDEYGGDTKRRARFALELVEVAKEKTASDYPIIFRLTADERVKEGYRVEYAIEICKLLQEAGIDAVDVVSGCAEAYEWTFPYMYEPRACNTSLSQAMRKEIRIPVLVAGRINDPYLAEEIIREGKADFIDLGRALIADPMFPKKAMEGEIDDIRKCIACIRCGECIDLHIPIVCTVNPAVGREKEFIMKTTTRRKRVLVVGGGPGGMEAALVATERGHHVTLWERSKGLGGQINLAVVPPGKQEIGLFLEYLKTQLDKAKVKVELGKEATPQSIIELDPDVIIIATGSVPLIPDIPGVLRENVVSNREVLSGARETGKKVIIMGGDLSGCETAELLATKGKDVTIICRSPMILEGVIPNITKPLLQRLKDKGVKVFSGIKRYIQISEVGLVFVGKEGKEILIEADTIVLSTGSVSNTVLVQGLKDKPFEVYEVGDCVEPRRILEAVHEGAGVALKI